MAIEARQEFGPCAYGAAELIEEPIQANRSSPRRQSGTAPSLGQLVTDLGNGEGVENRSLDRNGYTIPSSA